MHFKNIAVGAGFAGAIIARRLAEENGDEVLVVDKRDHIGGNAYDFYNEQMVLIHKYGPHIFHTDNKHVWDYLSRFTKWNLYQHRVLSYVDGMLVPMPISVETVNKLYNLNLSVNEMGSWLEVESEPNDDGDVKNSEDVALAAAGRNIYEKFFKNYTFKQWGVYPDQLSPDVIKRIPIRTNRDTRYFSDKYQGLPKMGYTEMFKKILDHPNIRIMLNTSWDQIKEKVSYDRLYYTGAIDSFYNYQYGYLGYRSVNFKYETFYDREYFQETATVNYPNDYDFTRITEYKHMTGQKAGHTTIAYEFSSGEGEPFYPVPDKKNELTAQKYMQLAQNEKNIKFLGRLAEYKYYNMDKIVEKGLELTLY